MLRELFRSTFTIAFFILVTCGQAATNTQLNALGVLSVKQYGAVGDGITDDTTAIQNAINAGAAQSMTVLFPEGTYLVSSTLKCLKRDSDVLSDGTLKWNLFQLVGSTQGTRPIIKLKNNCTGFNRAIADLSVDGPKAKPVVWIACWNDYDEDGVWDFNDASGNGICDPGEEKTVTTPGGEQKAEKEHASSMFNSGIRNLDFDLGTGNTSACAIHFEGAQQCFLEDIKIAATSGFCGIYGMIGVMCSFGNIEIVGGRCGIYGSGPHPGVSAVKLTNQSDYAVFYTGGTPMTLTGFQIVKAGAPAIRLNQNHNYYADMVILDGTIEFSAANGKDAIENPNGEALYMHDIYVKNATNIVKSGSRNPIVGGSGWKRVTEYASPEMGHTLNKNIINGVKNTNEYATVGPAATVPTDCITRHCWNPTDYPSPDDIYDRIHIDNDTTCAIGTEKGMQADTTLPDDPDDSVGFDNRAALQAIIDSGVKTILIPKGKFLIKKNPNANYGIRLGSETVMIGVGNYISELRTHDNWNPTAEAPLLTTPDSASASSKLAHLKLCIVKRNAKGSNDATNDWFNAMDWKAGSNSITRALYIWKVPWSASDATNAKADVKFSGNAGGRHFGTGACGQGSGDGPGNGFQRVKVTGTSQPLLFYNTNAEDGIDSPMFLVENSSNVALYNYKAEDLNGLQFRNCNNVAAFCRQFSADTVINNCTNTLIGLIMPNPPRAAERSCFTETGVITLPAGETVCLFKRGTFDWSGIKIPGRSDESNVKQHRKYVTGPKLWREETRVGGEPTATGRQMLNVAHGNDLQNNRIETVNYPYLP